MFTPPPSKTETQDAFTSESSSFPNATFASRPLQRVPSVGCIEWETGNEKAYEAVHAGVCAVLVIQQGHLDIEPGTDRALSVDGGNWTLLMHRRQDIALEIAPNSRGILLLSSPRGLAAYYATPAETPPVLTCMGCQMQRNRIAESGSAHGRIAALAGLLLGAKAHSFADRANQAIYVQELLATVLQQPAFAKLPEKCDADKSQCDIEIIERIAAYLEENFADAHSLVDLAKMHGINDFKLKKVFKHRYGTTVFAYLRRMRMEQARRLLRDGNTTVLDIACQVGYANPSHFSRAFRSEFGQNPRHFIGRG